MSIRDKLRSPFGIAYVRAGRFALWTILLILLLVCIVFEISDCGAIWEWLQEGDSRESNGATLRNVGLVVAAVIALLLAIWRSRVAQRQAATAERSLLNERYQKGAEMLGSKVLAVRLGGIYALQGLAEEDPKQYHVQIMKLFCAFARRPTHDGDDGIGKGKQSDAPDESDTETERRREDVRAVMEAIGSRSESDIVLEREDSFKLDLTGVDVGDADLRRANLSWIVLKNANLSGAKLNRANLSMTGLDGANLSKADLTGANLSGATLTNAKLCGAELYHANLSDAKLHGADLSRAGLGGAKLFNAQLNHANLSGASLYYNRSEVSDPTETKIPATGLTQAEFDKTVTDPDNPPGLDPAVIDAETGKPLVWRGERPGNR